MQSLAGGAALAWQALVRIVRIEALVGSTVATLANLKPVIRIDWSAEAIATIHDA
jgi:hypothetical protein